MPIQTGLDRLTQEGFESLRGMRIGVVCNQATVTSGFRHILEVLKAPVDQGVLKVQIVLGPQHGLFGHTQDNMIEWEGQTDPHSGFRIASLYGEHREPTEAMLKDVELLLIDLPDIGSRYYTFLWTMALCMKACEARGIPAHVLDRPNPIGGLQVEGTVLQPEFASFVGLYPLPLRHGMTLGEVANYLKQSFFPKCELLIVEAGGWFRGDDTLDGDAPWVMPSPNMPTPETALVYPGGCLLEGTNLSEGRGTTHPFELFGAPFVDGWQLADALNRSNLPGAHFRPVQFQPTFQKHAGKLCEGCFVHVTDRRAFLPALTYVGVLQEVRRLAGEAFAWNPPPYEYEYVKLPIDILAGNQWLREAIDSLTPLSDIRERFLEECSRFETSRKAALLYPPSG